MGLFANTPSCWLQPISLLASFSSNHPRRCRVRLLVHWRCTMSALLREPLAGYGQGKPVGSWSTHGFIWLYMRFVRRYCSVKLYGLNLDVDNPRPDNPKQEQQDVVRRDQTWSYCTGSRSGHVSIRNGRLCCLDREGKMRKKVKIKKVGVPIYTLMSGRQWLCK